MSISPRPLLQNTAPAVHGALDFAELAQWQLQADGVIDFSVNSNPFGPAPQIEAALKTVPLDRYPDREALALRRALASHLQLQMGQLLVGNGSAELFWLTTFTYLSPGDPVLIAGPTFGEYERCARMMGGAVHYCTAASPFLFDPQQLSHELERLRPKLFFCCHPNNPTGTPFPLDALATWIEQFPDTLFVVDEAYYHFVAELPTALAIAAPNLLVIRSMTKEYALAGLRLGYAVGSAELIAPMANVRVPWQVNGLAQAAGTAVFTPDAQRYYHDCFAALRAETAVLVSGLEQLGYQPLRSALHYFLLPIPAAEWDPEAAGTAAAQWRAALLPNGLIVRDCSSFGLPNHVRIATRKPAENSQLLTILEQHQQTRTSL